MKRTGKCYGRTDGRTDGGYSYNPLPVLRKGIEKSPVLGKSLSDIQPFSRPLTLTSPGRWATLEN